MRDRVMALNQFATIEVNRDPDGFAWFWRATFNQLCSMDVSFATLLRIDDTKLTDLGTIVSRDVEQSAIAHLSSHFWVTRRLIEDDIDFIRLLSGQHGLDNRFGLQEIIAEKSCGRTFQFVC